MAAGLDDHGDGAGVAEDPLHLLGRGGLVDRHGDGAGGPDRVVAERPLVAGLAHQADPVARLDAARDEPGGERADLGRELLGGDGGPPAVDLAGEDHVVGLDVGVLENGVGDVGVRVDLDLGGDGVLAHGVAPLRNPAPAT